MTEQAKHRKLLEDEYDVVKLAGMDKPYMTALQYAITACKALEQAGEGMPEEESEQCYYEHERNVAKAHNQAIDKMRPAFARILHENNELKADIRKDWIENVKPMRAENAKLIQENKDMKAEIKLHEKSLGETLDREYDLKAEGTKLEEQVEISNKIISNYYNETKDLKAECERLRDALHKATHIKLHPIDNIMGKKGNTTRMKGEQT